MHKGIEHYEKFCGVVYLISKPHYLPMTTGKWTRQRAAALHFAASAILLGILFLAVFLVWYPSPLVDALDLGPILLMLLAVDIVLGPVLTFLVFRPDKSSLKFDLMVIAFVQVFAFVYGCYTLWAARPVYIAAIGHRFDVVTANDVIVDDVVLANTSLPWHGPLWVGTRLASDPKERERIFFSGVSGFDYGHFPQHHQPIENMREELLKNAQPLASLKKLNPGAELGIDRWLERRGKKSDDVVFQGLKARAHDMAVILDAKTAQVIGIAPFKPWP